MISSIPAANPGAPETAAFDSDEQRYEAIRRRDQTAEGRFVYSVATTGVYCRPTCPSRLARRENVAFHAGGAAAERAGFRPCQRCRPDQPSHAERHAAAIAEACQRIEQADDRPPSLAELAAAAGLSRFHFHRLFKRIAGMTPRDYAAADRARRVQAGLRTGGSVTAAIYQAGYNSSSRFYESADRVLGMTPTAFRTGGQGTEIRFAVAACALGLVLVAATARGLCSIQFGDDAAALEAALRAQFPAASLLGPDDRFQAWVTIVAGFVEAPRRGLDLPLDLRGTAFQHRVWKALREIPPGTTATYSEIAARIGQPAAVRAVAGACAANPVAVAVPCHRVVRTDGSLSGYRWGVERKRALLDREQG